MWLVSAHHIVPVRGHWCPKTKVLCWEVLFGSVGQLAVPVPGLFYIAPGTEIQWSLC